MWRIAPAGDAALLVTLSEAIDPQILGRVLALDAALDALHLRGLHRPIPAYASLLCPFDPSRLDARELERHLRELEDSIAPQPPTGTLHIVLVHYDGPDLDRVADHARLSREQVVNAHSGREYLVYAIGFAPGFTYAGQLEPALATPRLSSPRQAVPAGSVGIAGRQTGIYAVESPGGWNLIGRTEAQLFDPATDPPSRIRAGDHLRFQPV